MLGLARAAPRLPRPRADLPAAPRPDLSWIDPFVARIRPHVAVRRADSLLILMPNEVHRLNATALALLSATLGGMPIEQFLRRVGPTPERRLEVADFFCALRLAIQGRLGEGGGLRAVEIVPFEGGFHRLPVLSEIALTARCNLSCTFCYGGCGPARSQPAMTTAEVKRVLQVVRRDAQVPSTSFTGGEPTLREDLPTLIDHARFLGMRVNLITNGTTATPERVRRWVDSGLASAQVSLEGGSAEVHDALTGVAGSFERTIAGIGAFRDSGLHVHTNTTVSGGNRDHLDGLVARVASLGLAKMSMNLVIPCGAARTGLSHVTVRYDEIGPLVERARERARGRGVELLWYSPVPLGFFHSAAAGLGGHGCAACDGLLSISPSGDVLPCSSWPGGVGNLLAEPFESVWRGREAIRLRAKASAPDACRGCRSFAICEGACPLYWEAMGTEEASRCREIQDAPA